MTSNTKNWGDLLPRLASAMVLIPLAGWCIWVGGIIYSVFLGLLVVGMLWEWKSMMKLPLNWRAFLACAWDLCALISVYFGKWREAAVILFSSWILGSSWSAGIVSIGIGGSALLWLRLMLNDGKVIVFMLVAIVMACDSAAYMGGRLLGGAKLAPKISPSKTWSGSVSGLVAAIGTCIIYVWAIHARSLTIKEIFYALLIGGLIGLGAQIGDLAESSIKRRCDVKDSGTILPGHGGLLDRFDGFLVAGPLTVLLTYLPLWKELFIL